MSRTSQTISSNNSQVVFSLYNNKNGQNKYTVLIDGTFSSGTVALYLSPDAGVTLYDLLDSSGAAVTAAAKKAVAFEAQSIRKYGNSSTPLSLVAKVTGAGTPSITVILTSSS
jgi:hypothetical protein